MNKSLDTVTGVQRDHVTTEGKEKEEGESLEERDEDTSGPLAVI